VVRKKIDNWPLLDEVQARMNGATTPFRRIHSTLEGDLCFSRYYLNGLPCNGDEPAPDGAVRRDFILEIKEIL